jgi:HEAT repeat protein
MIDATTKKIIRLLTDNSDAFVRTAAARLLGELSLKDREVSVGLLQAVEDKEQAVRLEAIHALGKLGFDTALPRLVEFIKQGGEESEAAADAAAKLGAKAVRGLQELMGHVSPGLRRRIAGALAASGAVGAHSAGVQALLDTDPGVVEAAARSLLTRIPDLPPAGRRELGDQVLAALNPAKGQHLAGVSEAALLRVLAGLHDPRGEKLFWSRLSPAHLETVRLAALQALGSLELAVKKDQLELLLGCATDTNFRIAAPALMLLKSIEPARALLPRWVKLFDAPDPTVRRFALEKLGKFDAPEVLTALAGQLHHPDRQIVDNALRALAITAKGKALLVKQLLEVESAEEAWKLARAMAPLLRDADAGVQKQLRAEAGERLEAADRRSDPLFFVLREIDPHQLRDELEARALAFRKKKDYQRALTYLRQLTRDPACSESVRFELAACGLKLSEQNLAGEYRASDPSLQQLARLAHSHEQPPVDRIKAAKWLAPDDLFYAGFHFAESSDRQERELGGALLQLVQDRSPRTKLAKDARTKQRAAGL